MAGDDQKLTYSERDRMRRDGDARPKSGHARAAEETRSRQALEAADSLFAGDQVGQEGEVLVKAVRAAHGTPELAAACRAYLDAMGPPSSPELASIFLDAGEKDMSVAVLDALLAQRKDGAPALEGGLKSQVRILSQDFDDDLASRAEDLLA